MPDPSPRSVAARRAQDELRWLDPGPLAELRRMTVELPAPTHWRLVAEDRRRAEAAVTIARHDQQAEWVAIVKVLAILTPKGSPADRPAVERTVRLGEALCDGGDPGWSGPRPVVSEHRLAQLLATRGERRAEALERAGRMLARTLPPTVRIDAADIARAILSPDNAHTTRGIAEAYYRRLDRALAAGAAQTMEDR